MMVYESAMDADALFVWFEGVHRRYLRIDALHWLVLVGESWERILDAREEEDAFQAGT